jgi:hypothetical protein
VHLPRFTPIWAVSGHARVARGNSGSAPCLRAALAAWREFPRFYATPPQPTTWKIFVVLTKPFHLGSCGFSSVCGRTALLFYYNRIMVLPQAKQKKVLPQVGGLGNG